MAGGEIVIQSLKKRSITPHYRPVPPSLLAELIAIHSIKGDAAGKLWAWSRSHAWRLVKATMIEAGLDPKKPYGTCEALRHGYCIKAISTGIGLSDIKIVMGHANIYTTTIYTGAGGNELWAMISRMWD